MFLSNFILTYRLMIYNVKCNVQSIDILKLAVFVQIFIESIMRTLVYVL